MSRIVLMILIGLCLPAQASELLRLEAHWDAVDGWEHCGKPVNGLLKVQGPAYVKRVSYEDPYTPLNFITWDPVGLARVTKEGAPRNDNPDVVAIYGKIFQDGKEVRNFRPRLLRREQLWHFTANEVYYYKVWIGSPCVRQSGGGQQKQDVLVIFKTQSGPDHIAEPDIPPYMTSNEEPTARRERWQVRLDPGAYISTFELRIDADGKVDGVSHWTCCSGPINRISGLITPSGDIQLTRHLEGDHNGMSHAWKGHYAADRKTIEGSWSSGSYGHGSGSWRAEVELSDGTAKPDNKTTGVVMGPLAGQWRITANGYPGMIEFTQSGGSWTGRENIDGAWQPIQDIVFDSGSGHVAFTRPRVAQRYKGTLSTKGMTGTFDQDGVGQYVWGATR